MKKIIILSGMLCLLASAANAQRISIQAIFGEPEPAYVEAPYYASPYPVYPTYAVEGARYRDWHDRGREHHEHHEGRHDRGHRR